MNRRRALVVLIVWYVVTLAVELCGAAGFVWQSGLLGGVGGTGPVSVLVVEESSDRDKLTEGQLEIIASHSPGSFLDWIKTHGERGRGGAYRVVDKDDSMGDDEPKWQAAFRAKGDSVPWLVVTRGGRVLLSEALPKEESETMRHLKRLGGN